MGEVVSIEEATYALDRAYAQGTPCEMLHDSHWAGLTEPYSEKSGRVGVELENQMIEAVIELYNDKWWKPPAFGDASEKIKKHESLVVSKKDAEVIWRRLWAILFDGEPDMLKQFISPEPVRYSEIGSASPEIDINVKQQYPTPLLQMLNAAIAEFFEPRRNVDAKKGEVVEWIKSKMIASGMADSDNIAAAIFTIIKPADHDPRKRRG